MSIENKKNKGQFYTDNCLYILDDLPLPSSDNIKTIVEPFAGKCDLIKWLEINNINISLELYDIEPKTDNIVQRDTLINPPIYKNKWILTNPPYLARNKSTNKEIYDKYNTNDLYKCFINSITEQEEQCLGGILIIPAGFFFSCRDIDVRCRNKFLSKYKLIKVKYFEEQVFIDTTITIVAFAFEKSNSLLTEQNVEWINLPSKEKRIFNMNKNNDWIIGGDIYKLPITKNIKIRRYVVGLKINDDEQITFITLSALDSGKKDGRICLQYKENFIYQAKDCSRTYATLCITGKKLSNEEQKNLCNEFNNFIEKKRNETWSLFLPQFRESKEYARKRIPFELVYRIVIYLLNSI